MTKNDTTATKPTGTIHETRSPKVFAESCPQCEAPGRIYAASETIKTTNVVDATTGEATAVNTRRRYVRCTVCDHCWAQDGPPASEKLDGDYIAGPCERVPAHGPGRIWTKNAVIPMAVCDQCGHQWRAVRKVE